MLLLLFLLFTFCKQRAYLKCVLQVSVLMGYSNTQDLVEQQRARRESATELIKVFKEIDFSEISAKFPCIKIGDASPIELYDDPTSIKCKETVLSENLTSFFQDSGGDLESTYEFPKESHPLSQTLTNGDDQSITEESSLTIQHISHEAQTRMNADDLSPSEDNSLSTQHSSQEPAVDREASPGSSSSDAMAPDNSILDKSIRCLPGTTSRQYRLLEEGGFHTVSILQSLHLFGLVKS
jgi:ATP-dependent DNA helicase RecG